MEAYRTFFKTRKWTLKVIIHFIDLACCNAWMEYRNFCREIRMPPKAIHDLLSFRLALAEALVADQTNTSVEWCSGSESGDVDLTPPSERYRPADQPCPEKRLDGINHWPEESGLKSARMCRRKECKSRTRTRCTKCDVYLCFSKKKNCFTIYHTKK
uniref:PiggyBac transposable element-derived protein domain-containing protein n=1 Tax=Bactrocera dorsalis TaxID=27457 RepID=A0A034WM56_BACDO